jgi:hypothetical protein
MITGRSHNHAGGQRSAVSRLPCHAGLPHSLVVARKRVITRVATSPRVCNSSVIGSIAFWRNLFPTCVNTAAGTPLS